MIGPFAWAWRAAVAALAAEGLDDVFGLPFVVGLALMIAAFAVELALGDWFRRNPLGDIRRVFALVLLRASQPLVWALAALGVMAD
ncbi:MAG TPA: hypothetical protein VJR58_01320 [Vineibacter sp.]|nr:hypothetical protein [Vineibacter sp.]